MLSLKDRMLVITEKCTYEVQLADQIDPKRTNPDLPHNVRRKLFDYGTSSDALCKTLLQGKALFREGFTIVDVNVAMSLTIEALKEFSAMDQSLREFTSMENAAVEHHTQAKQQARSIGLPSVGHVESHCKTFAQRAHHFGKAMLSIVRLFYPAASNWDKLQEIAEANYGKDDQFSKFVASIKPTLVLILNMRDSLEHQLPGVTVRDFAMELDGTVAPPTIELNFRKSKLPRCSVSNLMDEVAKAMLSYFQMMIVHMSSKFTQRIAGMEIYVVELPPEDQKARHVRFGYGVYDQVGRAVPFLG
ncbi:hypothetical protein [Bradyrhizobium sp. URHD0069]|uniref:hypothetical protein n=1 Tax=Bradyrhizobium sp. URHD0069 TaxID=1380355 RepID=UPI000A61DFDB|nr:hypothetical protein [Bradyrhizobium sp. URHD0069]